MLQPGFWMISRRNLGIWGAGVLWDVEMGETGTRSHESSMIFRSFDIPWAVQICRRCPWNCPSIPFFLAGLKLWCLPHASSQWMLLNIVGDLPLYLPCNTPIILLVDCEIPNQFPSHFSTHPILRDDPQDGHVSLWDIRASPHVSVVSWPQWPQCPNGSRSFWRFLHAILGNSLSNSLKKSWDSMGKRISWFIMAYNWYQLFFII